jgi:hypothetical protein
VAKKSKGKIIQSIIRKARKLQKATESNPKNLKKAENLLEIVSGLKVSYYCSFQLIYFTSMSLSQILVADPIIKFAISHDQTECNSIMSSVSS